MRKHLHRIGNSYGIIIDKAICRVLGIGPRSVLEVSTDGERILIERTGQLLTERELPEARHILADQEQFSIQAQSRKDVSMLAQKDGASRPGASRSGASKGGASSSGANNVVVNRKLLQADIEAVSLDFERRFYARPAQLQRLHHVPNARFVGILAWLSGPLTAERATDEELATLLRMRYCRDQLRTGYEWDEAIEMALRAYPMTSTASLNATAARQPPAITSSDATAAQQPPASPRQQPPTSALPE